MRNNVAASRKSSEENLSRVVLKHWREVVPDDRMAHLVKDATRAFLRALQVRLAKHDVPLGMWTFLRILWEKDGLTQRELSQAAGVMEPSTVTALRAMETRGYVLREQKPGNRKSIYVFLTPTGRWLENTLVPLAEEVNAIATEGVAAEDIATTRKVLLAILENLAGDEARLSQAEAAAQGNGSRRKRAKPRKPAAAAKQAQP